MVFSKEDKILIKNLRQLKGYTATHCLKDYSQVHNQKLDKSTNSDIVKRTVIQIYNSAKWTIFRFIVC